MSMDNTGNKKMLTTCVCKTSKVPWCAKICSSKNISNNEPNAFFTIQ
jgi:hypothetical protein